MTDSRNPLRIRRQSERESGPATASTWGELLRRHRQLAGLTQEALAAASGYSADYIRKIERGRRRPPPDALDRLAESLGLGASDRASLHAAAAARDDDDHPIPRLVGRDHEIAEV